MEKHFIWKNVSRKYLVLSYSKPQFALANADNRNSVIKVNEMTVWISYANKLFKTPHYFIALRRKCYFSCVHSMQLLWNGIKIAFHVFSLHQNAKMDCLFVLCCYWHRWEASTTFWTHYESLESVVGGKRMCRYFLNFIALFGRAAPGLLKFD